MWYPALPNGKYCLVNFIAVEPATRHGKGFSELENSNHDELKGKRFSVSEPATVQTLPSGAEQLKVRVDVERFNNGAHVYLVITQRSDRPNEIQLRTHTQPDSDPMDYCVLTATWGNITRCRQLWLKDRTINSLERYGSYQGNAFAPEARFPLNTLRTLPNGAVVVALTSDESDLASVYPVKGTKHFWCHAKDSHRVRLEIAVMFLAQRISLINIAPTKILR